MGGWFLGRDISRETRAVAVFLLFSLKYRRDFAIAPLYEQHGGIGKDGFSCVPSPAATVLPIETEREHHDNVASSSWDAKGAEKFWELRRNSYGQDWQFNKCTHHGLEPPGSDYEPRVDHAVEHEGRLRDYRVLRLVRG